MTATQKMVAEKAGVSRTTVSYALSEGPYRDLISPAVRRRVIETAEALGYCPNRQARSLVTGCSKTMALMVQAVAGSNIWMWNEAAAGAEEELFFRNYNVLVSRVNANRSMIDQASHLHREGSVDGVVGVLWGQCVDDLRRAAQLDFPMIFVTIGGDEGSSHVIHDATVGVREALRHAHELGHRSLAWVMPALPKNDSSLDRLRSICTEAKRLGMTTQTVRVRAEGRYLGPRYHELLPEILDDLRLGLPDPQSASVIMCWNDLLAHAVCAVLTERGLRIPDDVSVIGFDDIEPSIHVPPLTTVSGAYREMGAAAARLALEDAPSSHINSQTIVVPTYLVVRGSAGRARTTTERTSGHGEVNVRTEKSRTEK